MSGEGGMRRRARESEYRVCWGIREGRREE